jgi:UDP-glucose 4-epimerase
VRGTGDTRRHAVVTGGSGFIGSHLVERLLGRGDRVTVIDDLSTGLRANLDDAGQAHGEKLRVVVGDAQSLTPDVLRDDPASELYHLAAAVGVRRVVDDPAACIEANVTVAAAVLEAALAQPSPPSVLIASSSEVYGKSRALPFTENADLAFGPTSSPRWSYGMAKALDEHLLLSHTRGGRLRGMAVRFFNTVGPRQRGDYGMVVPRFIEMARAGGPVTVYGDGTQTRCFCDVRDIAPALPTLLAAAPEGGTVVNLGSDRPVSINQLAELVVSTVNPGVEIARIPYTDVFGPDFEDLAERRPDLTRLRSLIDFSPAVTLEQTVSDLAARAAASGKARTSDATP